MRMTYDSLWWLLRRPKNPKYLHPVEQTNGWRNVIERESPLTDLFLIAPIQENWFLRTLMNVRPLQWTMKNRQYVPLVTMEKSMIVSIE